MPRSPNRPTYRDRVFVGISTRGSLPFREESILDLVKHDAEAYGDKCGPRSDTCQSRVLVKMRRADLIVPSEEGRFVASPELQRICEEAPPMPEKSPQTFRARANYMTKKLGRLPSVAKIELYREAVALRDQKRELERRLPADQPNAAAENSGLLPSIAEDSGPNADEENPFCSPVMRPALAYPSPVSNHRGPLGLMVAAGPSMGSQQPLPAPFGNELVNHGLSSDIEMNLEDLRDLQIVEAPALSRVEWDQKYNALKADFARLEAERTGLLGSRDKLQEQIERLEEAKGRSEKDYVEQINAIKERCEKHIAAKEEWKDKYLHQLETCNALLTELREKDAQSGTSNVDREMVQVKRELDIALEHEDFLNERIEELRDACLACNNRLQQAEADLALSEKHVDALKTELEKKNNVFQQLFGHVSNAATEFREAEQLP
ncbi:hypothetical protein A0H81_06113 [Grifola frondosa]|uniref:Uncharacterized protein n=1 Tax=Grifola frondosa TaxID=5627 RepID=A0A1C7MBZ9_GRIFR|nr:hypothetical protein A0H81_06113 [Grifola frondosa]